ncbi:MAG TPA: histidine--tRNA ligase [Candidatus Babeliales bacterium]|nr:histidine--tRNA ligase [Candidatus Babeliales bacterium]
MISRIKGTRDVLDLTLFNFVIDRAQKFFSRYHFNEISLPIIEPGELFKRTLGEHTDVVLKEMYCFTAHDEGQEICLRPEVTASTVRAFVENNIEQLPWKVFTWGPMFRHERPQKGRYRQFNQLNLEVIGSASVSQDVLFIMMLDRYFSHELKFNNYALLLNFLGCREDRIIFKEKLYSFLDKNSNMICKTCLERKEKNILRVFDCKNSSCQELYERAPKIIDKLCQICQLEWDLLQEQLSLNSISFAVNPTLVRGLDYYNKTVFEFSSQNLGAQTAFCGGGRYDQLASYCGAKEDQPCVGAAIGIERLTLLLEQIQNELPMAQKPALQVIIPMNIEQYSLALLLADQLISKGLTVDILFEGSLKSRMRKANKMAAQHTLILGEDELAKREVMVKNMMNGQEQRIAQIELADYFLKNRA